MGKTAAVTKKCDVRSFMKRWSDRVSIKKACIWSSIRQASMKKWHLIFSQIIRNYRCNLQLSAQLLLSREAGTRLNERWQWQLHVSCRWKFQMQFCLPMCILPATDECRSNADCHSWGHLPFHFQGKGRIVEGIKEMLQCMDVISGSMPICRWCSCSCQLWTFSQVQTEVVQEEDQASQHTHTPGRRFYLHKNPPARTESTRFEEQRQVRAKRQTNFEKIN